ncbi:MAG: hybrid sensor histidine kinase/response regulator [Cyanobacteria bacterium P01_F01_bin.150]
MFIEDEELRSLYRDASSDHLNTLESGLLYLEKHPQDVDRIKELLRATHSLKGDSRMLGVKDAETLTHQMEDLLGTVAQGERSLTPQLCDSLYQGLDAVRQVVNEAITGDPSEVSVFHVLAQLMNTEDDGDYPRRVVEADPQLETNITHLVAVNAPVSEALINELIIEQKGQSIHAPDHEPMPRIDPNQEWLTQSFDEDSLFLMSDAEVPLYSGPEETPLSEEPAEQEALAELLTESLVDLFARDTQAPQAAPSNNLPKQSDEPEEAPCTPPDASYLLSGTVDIVQKAPLDDYSLNDYSLSDYSIVGGNGDTVEETLPNVPLTVNSDADTTQVRQHDASPVVPRPTHRPRLEEKAPTDIEQSFEQYVSPNETSRSNAIETVRVKASKLDTLMTQAGELAVTQRRISRRMGDIEAMLLLWEKWSQATLANNSQVDHLREAMGEEAFTELQKSRQLSDDYLAKFGTLLKQLYSSTNEDTAQLNSLSNELESGILELRQISLNSLFAMFPRMVRDITKQQGKIVNFVMEGGENQADKRIIEEMKAPLTHLIRNAIDHGIEMPEERVVLGKSSTAELKLKAYQQGNQIILEVSDDGRGLNLENIKRTAIRRGLHSEAELASMSPERLQSLIFSPGFSTRTTVTELSGRGVGLDVVRVNVERLKGTIHVQSIPSKGCTFRFTLKTTVGTTSALILQVNETPYAIPLESIDRMMRVAPHEIFMLEGRPTITIEEHPVSVVWLCDLLNLSPSETPLQNKQTSPSMTCVILQIGSERLGLFVDQLIDQQDIVLKAHSKLLKRVRNIAGATILGTGQVCMVLSPQDLIRSAQGTIGEVAGIEWAIAPPVKHRVLLVEDSIPIRTQVRRILEGAGYRVTTAVDGRDGLEKLTEDSFDAVVSDVEMPHLDGLELTSQIRQQSKYGNLPIILVTTLAKPEDKRRGVLAGANAYITKGDFDQSLLIQTLRRLI